MSNQLARTVLVLFALGILATGNIGWARDAGGTASNGFDNNGDSSVPASAYDPGKKERESKAYKKKTDPDFRDYYEKGGKSSNHDSKCRARLAYKAATYNGPQNDYANGKPKAGGGKYGEFPEKPEDIIHNIYKFVEDMLYPRKASDAINFKDKDICDALERDPPALDIGKPLPDPKLGFACIVTAHFFTSLVRELGFPAMEKNIVYSNADGKFTYQTAAANVWYGNEWHFFDPWESFLDYEQYLTDEGHASVRPGMYHDAWVWERDTPPDMGGGIGVSDYHFILGFPRTDLAGWGGKAKKKMKLDGVKVIFESIGLRGGIRQGEQWLAGTMQDGNVVIESADVIYVRYDDPIPRSRLEPLGPETFGYELITLLYDKSASNADLAYTIVVSNITDQIRVYSIEIEGMPATREIDVTFERGSNNGHLQAGEAVEIPLRVSLGDPLLLAPKPVRNIKPTGKDGNIELHWELVEGATSYRIYRSQQFQKEFDQTISELISETEDNSIKIQIGDDDFIILLAVNAEGMVSELDFETGSVFVWDAEYYADIDSAGELSMALLGLLTGLAIVLWIFYRRGRGSLRAT